MPFCRLIVNADDFGLSEAISEGIVRALTEGVVTSTTIMPCAEAAEACVRRHATTLCSRAGVHLQLTGGDRPVLPPENIPSLVDQNGRFPRSKKDVQPIHPDELAEEWRAQIERVRSWGIDPTHLDSHHHQHGREDCREVFAALCAECGLSARCLDDAMHTRLNGRKIDHPRHLITDFFGADVSAEHLQHLLRSACATSHGCSIELMCHPGLMDKATTRLTTYTEGRERELALLTDPQTAALLDRMDVECIGFAEVVSDC